MHRFFLILLLVATSPQLCAQDAEGTEDALTTSASAEETRSETGAAAAASAESTLKNNWQNWVFAGSALLTVTAGVVIISLNAGTTSH
jgi:hypothetical protein